MTIKQIIPVDNDVRAYFCIPPQTASGKASVRWASETFPDDAFQTLFDEGFINHRQVFGLALVERDENETEILPILSRGMYGISVLDRSTLSDRGYFGVFSHEDVHKIMREFYRYIRETDPLKGKS